MLDRYTTGPREEKVYQYKLFCVNRMKSDVNQMLVGVLFGEYPYAIIPKSFKSSSVLGRIIPSLSKKNRLKRYLNY